MIHHNKLIIFCGNSCSGKTSLCQLISEKYGAVHIQQDWFYLPRSPIITCGLENWDCYESINWDLCANSIAQLINGNATKIPASKLTNYVELEIKPSKYIVLDGFIAPLNDKLLELADHIFYLDINSQTIKDRRFSRKDGMHDKYVDVVSIPQFEKYRDMLVSRSNTILNGEISPGELLEKVKYLFF